nr:hypothetical protein [Tanacetum cinerariifolium]
MADMNIPANDVPANQAPAIAPLTRTDDQILPHRKWVHVGKSNYMLDVQRSQRNTIFKQVQSALYNGREIIKTNHVSAIVHNSEDTLEIAEITRKKMNDKMKDPECVKKKVKIAPHDYLKDNYLATFTPQKQLTLEQIFWSKDLLKMTAEALKEQTTTSRQIKVLTLSVDEQWFNLHKDIPIDAPQITPINDNDPFVAPPSSDAVIEYVNTLGYPCMLRNVFGMYVNDLYQPWRDIFSMINMCLTGKTAKHDRPTHPVLQIL